MLEFLTQLTLLGLGALALVFIYLTVIHILALCLGLTTNPDDTEN